MLHFEDKTKKNKLDFKNCQHNALFFFYDKTENETVLNDDEGVYLCACLDCGLIKDYYTNETIKGSIIMPNEEERTMRGYHKYKRLYDYGINNSKLTKREKRAVVSEINKRINENKTDNISAKELVKKCK